MERWNRMPRELTGTVGEAEKEMISKVIVVGAIVVIGIQMIGRSEERMTKSPGFGTTETVGTIATEMVVIAVEALTDMAAIMIGIRSEETEISMICHFVIQAVY
jgi:hypothetical protein